MLKLKSVTKKLFKDVGLSDITVGRDNSGYISLVGVECNKPVLTIGSIQVGTKLSKVESEIVINEYIIPTLDKYAEDIRMYVDRTKHLAKNLIEQEELYKTLKSTSNLTSSITNSKNPAEISAMFFSHTESYNDIKISVNEGTGMLSIDMRTRMDLVDKVVKDTMINWDRCETYRNSFRSNKLEQARLEELKASLTASCSF